MGIPVDDVNYAQAIARISELIEDWHPSRMVVINASKTVLAQMDRELLEIIQRSDLVTADGMSIVWAARLLGGSLRARVTGIDLMGHLVALAARTGYPTYFLGAREEAVVATVRHFSEKYPGLVVAGLHDGYFDKNGSGMAEAIRASGARLLFVALGSPLQEKWIAANQGSLGPVFCLGVGGSFDHVAGFARRAPAWMQRAGLEWLHRLICDPRRLWRRYLIGNTRFLVLVFRQWISRYRTFS